MSMKNHNDAHIFSLSTLSLYEKIGYTIPLLI